MSIVLIIIIAATALISFIAFSNQPLFEKYKFNVGAITNKQEYIRLISAGFLILSVSFLVLALILTGGLLYGGNYSKRH